MARTLLVCPQCKGLGNIEVELYQCEICGEATNDVSPIRLALERGRVGYFHDRCSSYYNGLAQKLIPESEFLQFKEKRQQEILEKIRARNP